MDEIKYRYMLVDLIPSLGALNLVCSFTTVPYASVEVFRYINKYNAHGNEGEWIIYSSAELTVKLIAIAVQYAEQTLVEARLKNAKRPVVGRK